MTSLGLLVTGVGSTTAQSVIKGVRRQREYDVHVVGVDINAAEEIAGSAFCDTFYQVPPASEGRTYVERLVEIVRSESIDLLAPIVDAELPVVAEHRSSLSEECAVLVSDPETIDICNDKHRTYEWLSDRGYPTPETLSDPDADDMQAAFGPDRHLIAKPRRGVSSRDVYELRSPAEYPLVERIDDPVVQPKVDGTEYTVDVYRSGDETTAVPRERVDTRAGISYVGRVVDDERLAALAAQVVDDLGIRGPANVQCFVDGDDVWLFEVNPRFSGSLTLTMEAGLNSPLLALQWAVGDSVTHPDAIDEVTMQRFWNEVFRTPDGTRVRDPPQS